MLSEQHYFEAKYFLNLYKDSLLCAEQAARKRGIIAYHQKFYDKLQEAYEKNQLSFDSTGHIIRTDSTKDSYYYHLFTISEQHVGRKINFNQSYSYEEFNQLLDTIISSLETEINQIQESQNKINN